ncbi:MULTISPECIES: hypothetical protein [unclassified Sporosarcina]|uniref:hypothetical protein n=1 Tax=unclassified Sporosarcina TaxID=2647733 RepID=UPI001A90CD70|nr:MULTISPECIES: hypothetical protein [unclassified Sporosarcina]MBO0588198.1 hypothetical protein [Sporosarcina sp. E16_8]MBO0601952.1 hypothetical protein [Sporosarcina sp. E16_3]
MRIQTVWHCSKTAIFKDDLPGFLRIQESEHWRLLVCESDVEFSEIKHLYTQIKRNGFTCRSIKLFFAGSLPDLSSYGYIREGEWYVYPHKQIEIAGIPYGKNEWCLLIEKRTGHGVPMHVLDFVPVYQEDYQTTLWEGIIS